MTQPVDAARSDGSKRVGFLELFFDLVFVFAITQLVGLLHDDHTAAGWTEAGLMMWLVWWAWSQYAWAGNAIDLDRRVVRAAMLAITGTMLLAAVSIPGAFTCRGIWFAVPYVAVRVAGLALYWTGLRFDRNHQRALRSYLPAAMLSPIVVLVGGVVGAEVRPWLWALAVLIDVLSVMVAGRGEFRVDPAHFAERHGLIVIIALGESVVAVGVTASSLETSGGVTTTVIAGFWVVAVLWWSYFDWVNQAAERRLESEADHRRRSNLARDLFTFGHLPIVAGTVIFAAGIEEVLLHPLEAPDSFARLALGAGPIMFLAGFVVGNYRSRRVVLVERSAACAAVAGIAWGLGRHVDGVVVVTVIAATLTAAIAVEHARRARADLTAATRTEVPEVAIH